MYFYAKIKDRHPLKASGTQHVQANSMGMEEGKEKVEERKAE